MFIKNKLFSENFRKIYLILLVSFFSIGSLFLTLWIVNKNSYQNASENSERSLLESKKNNEFNWHDIISFDLRLNGEKVDFKRLSPRAVETRPGDSSSVIYLQPFKPEGYYESSVIVYDLVSGSEWSLRTSNWFTIEYNNNLYPINIPIVNTKMLANDYYYYTNVPIYGKTLTVGKDNSKNPIGYRITKTTQDRNLTWHNSYEESLSKYSSLEIMSLVLYIVLYSISLVFLMLFILATIRRKMIFGFSSEKEAISYYDSVKFVKRKEKQLTKDKKNKEIRDKRQQQINDIKDIEEKLKNE